MVELLDEQNRKKIELGRERAKLKAEQAFDQLDTNKDGHLDKNEIIELTMKHLPGVAAEDTSEDQSKRESKILEFFSIFDENRDGRIQKDEWMNFFAKLFDKIIDEELRQSLSENNHSAAT